MYARVGLLARIASHTFALSKRPSIWLTPAAYTISDCSWLTEQGCMSYSQHTASCLAAKRERSVQSHHLDELRVSEKGRWAGNEICSDCYACQKIRDTYISFHQVQEALLRGYSRVRRRDRRVSLPTTAEADNHITSLHPLHLPMGVWDFSCAICGAPFRIAAPPQPSAIPEDSLTWLTSLHLLGRNIRTRKPFLTGLGKADEYGFAIVERGADPDLPPPGEQGTTAYADGRVGASAYLDRSEVGSGGGCLLLCMRGVGGCWGCVGVRGRWMWMWMW